MSKTKPCGSKSLIAQIVVVCGIGCLVITTTGCEALVRKFTRKPKKEDLPKEELVLVPEEYKAPVISKEEAYRQYFLFWKSWQDELINSLDLNGMNYKKQLSCVEEAIKNLGQLKVLFKDDKQKKLEKYLARLDDLKNDITRDVYGVSVASSRQTAEMLKSDILRELSYTKIKDDLK